MTSLAFILARVPPALSSGASSASRHAIGSGLIGCALAATVLAPLFVPLCYRLIEAIRNRFSQRSADMQGEIKHA